MLLKLLECSKQSVYRLPPCYVRLEIAIIGHNSGLAIGRLGLVKRDSHPLDKTPFSRRTDILIIFIFYLPFNHFVSPPLLLLVRFVSLGDISKRHFHSSSPNSTFTLIMLSFFVGKHYNPLNISLLSQFFYLSNSL